MQDFFEKYGQENAARIINAQKNKIIINSKRYANIIREKFGKDYVKNGVALSLSYADKIKKEGDQNV